MQIKELSEKNIQDLLDFEKENAPEKPDYVKYTLEDLREFFDTPNKGKPFGIYDGDILRGWSSYRIGENNLWEVSSLVVDKNSRGKGVGKTLLMYVVHQIQSINPTADIFLTVYPGNLPALFLYLKSGFEIYDYKRDYYGPGAHRLFLKYNPDKK